MVTVALAVAATIVVLVSVEAGVIVTVVEPVAEEYPSPAFVIVIAVTDPPVSVATAVAFDPAPLIVTIGATVYPLPGLVMVSAVTGPPDFCCVHTAVSVNPAVFTAVLTSLFCTGSISLRSMGTSAS